MAEVQELIAFCNRHPSMDHRIGKEEFMVMVSGNTARTLQKHVVTLQKQLWKAVSILQHVTDPCGEYSQEKIDKLKDSMPKRTQSNGDAGDAVYVLNEELQRLRGKNAEIKDLYDNMKRQRDDAVRNEQVMKGKLDKALKDEKTMKGERDDAVSLKKSLQSEITRLTEQNSDDQKRYQKVLQDLEKEVADLKNCISEQIPERLSEHIKQWKEAMDVDITKLCNRGIPKDKISEVDKLKRHICDLRRNLLNASRYIVAVDEKLEANKREMNEFSERALTMFTAEKILQEMQPEFEKCKQDKENLARDLEIARDNLKKTREETEDVIRKNQELQDVITHLEDSVTQVKINATKWEADITQLSANLKDEQEKCRQAVETASKECERAIADRKRAETRLRDKELELDRTKQKLEDFRNTYKQLEASIKLISESGKYNITEIIDGIRGRIGELEENSQSLCEELTKKDIEIEKYKEKIRDLETRNIELEEDKRMFLERKDPYVDPCHVLKVLETEQRFITWAASREDHIQTLTDEILSREDEDARGAYIAAKITERVAVKKISEQLEAKKAQVEELNDRIRDMEEQMNNTKRTPQRNFELGISHEDLDALALNANIASLEAECADLKKKNHKFASRAKLLFSAVKNDNQLIRELIVQCYKDIIALRASSEQENTCHPLQTFFEKIVELLPEIASK